MAEHLNNPEQTVNKFHLYWQIPYPEPVEAACWGAISIYLSRIIRETRPDSEIRRLRILDMDCGNGRRASAAQAYGTCHGATADMAAIEAARRRYPNLQFFEGAAADVARRSDFMPYDVALISNIIEKEPTENRIPAIEQICALVRPGGHVILKLPRGELFDKYKSKYGVADAQYPWPRRNELKKAFAKYNFRCVATERVPVSETPITFFEKTLQRRWLKRMVANAPALAPPVRMLRSLYGLFDIIVFRNCGTENGKDELIYL